MQSINLDYLLRARRYLGELIPNDGHLVCLPVSISAKSVGCEHTYMSLPCTCLARIWGLLKWMTAGTNVYSNVERQ